MKDLAKVEEICFAAMQRPLDERKSFLDEVCGDEVELRREVESLLSFEEKAKNFIETPPQDVAAAVFNTPNHKNLVGTNLNYYRIVAALGAGGMGEVFLAEDEKLGRKVALKLLHRQFLQDSERIRRFEREARAVSALNHPNIITIYAIEETENLNFIATELVEGKTLREKISEKPFSSTETVEIGLQVANALESAHTVGIIHRDIKPANIMIRHDGIVKVLDFGLAKLIESENAEADIWNSAEGEISSTSGVETASQITRQTNRSAIMGTLNYMSPEQTLGEKIDARTDIFSLGVVLYEMLSGKQPFAGASDEDIYDATLNKMPVPLRRLNAEIPSELERIIGKALEKNKENRYQTVSALRQDLQKLQQPANSKLRWALPLALALMAISAGLYFFVFRQTPAINPFQTIKLDRLTAQGLTITNAVSPDGNFIVYAKKETGIQSLWIKKTDNSAENQIVPATPMEYQFLNFSPNGESIYFVGKENVGTSPTLFEISTDGQNRQKLIEGVNSQISFSPDRKSLAFVRDKDGEDNLVIAGANGGNEQILAIRKNPEVYNEGVSWSPDGKLIAVAALKRRTSFGGGIAVIDTKTGVETLLTLSEKVIRVSHLAWAKDGKGLVFCRYASPTGQRYQLQYAAFPGGQIQNITNDLASYEDLSLTADGKAILSVQREYSMGIWLTRENDFTKAAEIEAKTGRDDGERGISWTKDGKIVYVSSENEAQNIWRMDADGANRKPLTTGTEHGKLFPSFNKENGLITFFSGYGSGKADYFQMDFDGNNVRQVTNFGAVDFNASANRDWIVCVVLADGRKRIWKTPANGGEAVKLTEVESGFPAISPDGKFVSYIEMEKNQPLKIAVISIDGGSVLKSFELPVTAKIEAGITWTKEGDAILFVNTLGTTSNIWKQSLDGKPAKPVTDFKEFQIAAFALNAEGNRFAVSRGSRNRDAVLIKNIS